MGSILDDPKVRQAIYPMSVAFYHQAGELGLIGEDVELLEGNLVRKMSKSPVHSWLVQVLLQCLQQSLPSGYCVRKEDPLTFPRSEPEPDLAVVRGSLNEFRQAHPTTAELVIEVAVSTVEVDRQKAGIYAAAGVTEYWLLIPDARCIEVYREPTADGYRQRRVVSGPVPLESTALAGFRVALPELFPEPAV
ncbi:MAG: Uma2 family endonuclease [Verrucomicrobia bacterium]|nr:Uma2 family endonuclease [Verrucomicrobiota bacterium]